MAGAPVTKGAVAAWKEKLLAAKQSPGTVNGALAALHGFFDFMEWSDCRVKYLKVQRRMFRDTSKELTKNEYLRLVQTAQKQGNHRLVFLLEIICSTGIRVSEVRYITVEALQKGRVDIVLKGKIRTILFPDKLAKKLRKYAEKQKIASVNFTYFQLTKAPKRCKIWNK